MAKKFLFFSLFILFSLTRSALATVPVVTDILGTSNRTITAGTTAGTTSGATIYGGLGGAPCGATNGLCDSCDATFTACNPRRINDNTIVTFQLKANGTAAAKVIKDTTGTTQIGSIAGTNTEASVTWGDLCDELAGSNCEGVTSTESGTIKVWQDTNSNNTADADEVLSVSVKMVKAGDNTIDDCTADDGICPFETFPGDEKLFIDIADGGLHAGWPNMANGSTVKEIMIFASEAGFNSANYVESLEPAVFSVDSTGGLEPLNIDGLQNGKVYSIRLALVDQAGNISNWTDEDVINGTAPGSNGSLANCPLAAPVTLPGRLGCPLAGRPDEVLGLLSEDINCFIATAAYGSSLEPKLTVFRKFRQIILLPTDTGRKIVNWYYNYGPKAARWINDKPVVKSIVRLALWPAYAFASISLRFGFALATAGFALGLFFFLSMGSLALRRRTARAKK